jgi:hypothetical protein
MSNLKIWVGSITYSARFRVENKNVPYYTLSMLYFHSFPIYSMIIMLYSFLDIFV